MSTPTTPNVGQRILDRLEAKHRDNESHFSPYMEEEAEDGTIVVPAIEDLYLNPAHHEDHPGWIIFEDAMSDILAFLHEPFRALADELEATYGDRIDVFVQPSIEDNSFVLVTSGAVVLLTESLKHWNFHFESLEAFAEHLAYLYEKAKRELLRKRPWVGV